MLSLLVCLALLAPMTSAHAVEIAPDQVCKRVLAAESELVAGGLSPADAAIEVQAQVTASEMVEAAYRNLTDHPTGKSLARELLWSTAVDQVRSRLGHEMPPAMDRALQRMKERGTGLIAQADRGQRQLRDLSKYLNDPTEALKGPKTTPQEDYTLATLALTRLLKGDAANASHVMDLILAAQDPAVRAPFEAAGISPLELTRDILLHDLGKQYNDPHLASYRAFLETVFPGQNNFVSTRVMPHELGSMIILAELAREAGIEEGKIPRLQALLANHNAGYDPALKGAHFWVNAWGAFAKEMRAAGIPVPEVYGAVLSKEQGGDKLTTALTSLDRGVSLTLASHEKFSNLLLNTGRWNAEEMAKLFDGNIENVPLEIENVISRLSSFASADKAQAVQRALNDYFGTKAKETADLGEKLRAMAAIAPPPTDIPGTSIAYQTKEKTWYRVNSEGKAYKWDGQAWAMHIDGKKFETPEILFRRIIFPDIGYAVPTLAKPDALVEFRR